MQTPRAIKPDGEKIKDLRARAGKTQKELLRDAPVTLRTYQRAEQGLPISPAYLREIASLLGVPLSDITLSPRPQPECIRFHACAGSGGLNLLRQLQQLMVDLEFDFRVDPYGDVANEIAAVVGFCQDNHPQTLDDGSLDDAEFIAAVGELNVLIAKLYARGIEIYVAAYFYWEALHFKHRSGKRIHFPVMNERLQVIFSADAGPSFIEAAERSHETYAGVLSRCHRRNRGAGITAVDIEKAAADALCVGIDLAEYGAEYLCFLDTQEVGAGAEQTPPVRTR